MVSNAIPPATLSPCSENALACERAVCNAATPRQMTVWMSAMMARLRLFRMENECITAWTNHAGLGKHLAVTEITGGPVFCGACGTEIEVCDAGVSCAANPCVIAQTLFSEPGQSRS